MNKSLPSRFTVSIPVKPYVKRFLDINFGLPIDFTKNAHSCKHFQSLFKNGNAIKLRKVLLRKTYTDIRRQQLTGDSLKSLKLAFIASFNDLIGTFAL